MKVTCYKKTKYAVMEEIILIACNSKKILNVHVGEYDREKFLKFLSTVVTYTDIYSLEYRLGACALGQIQKIQVFGLSCNCGLFCESFFSLSFDLALAALFDSVSLFGLFCCCMASFITSVRNLWVNIISTVVQFGSS